MKLTQIKKAAPFIALLLLGGCSPSAPKGGKPSIYVTSSFVTKRDALLYRDYIGHVEPYISVNIQSQVQGILEQQHFVEGATVKKGDKLFTIDARFYQATLDKANALLQENLASLNFAKEAVTRYSKLVSAKYVSQIDYDKMVSQVAATNAQINQNEADIDKAKLNLEYCNITAPMDGITGNVQIKVGNLVQVASSTPLVTLNQICPILISFYIPERDLAPTLELQRQNNLVAQVHSGTRCFEAKLYLINNQVNESTGTILLQAVLPNEEMLLWPGQFATVRLILGEAKNALLLPVEAVQIGAKGSYVYIIKPDKTVELKMVTTGQREGEEIIIQSGLNGDEEVVLEGHLNLSPGASVTIKNKEEKKA
jgi:membrane fusion protein, multidrug efflux system